MIRKRLAQILIDLVGYILEKIKNVLKIFFFPLNFYSKDFYWVIEFQNFPFFVPENQPKKSNFL